MAKLHMCTTVVQDYAKKKGQKNLPLGFLCCHLHSCSLLKTSLSVKLHSCWFISYDRQLPSPSFKMKGSLHGPCLESSPFLCVPAGCRRCVLSGGALGCCWLSAEWARPYLSADKQTCGQSKPAVKRQVIVLHVFFFFNTPTLPSFEGQLELFSSINTRGRLPLIWTGCPSIWRSAGKLCW